MRQIMPHRNNIAMRRTKQELFWRNRARGKEMGKISTRNRGVRGYKFVALM